MKLQPSLRAYTPTEAHAIAFSPRGTAKTACGMSMRTYFVHGVKERSDPWGGGVTDTLVALNKKNVTCPKCKVLHKGWSEL